MSKRKDEWKEFDFTPRKSPISNFDLIAAPIGSLIIIGFVFLVLL